MAVKDPVGGATRPLRPAMERDAVDAAGRGVSPAVAGTE